MARVKLILEYDGSNYVGWQIQKNGISVQEKLQEALQELLREKIKVTASGRTDAGVHAFSQVVHFDTGSPLPDHKIVRGLNYYLPPDIRIKEAEYVAPDFHARYDAKRRTYRYYIALKPTAVFYPFRWLVTYKLDIASMHKAASRFVGEHQFTAFCSTDSETENHWCNVYEAEWEARGDELIFKIVANRFLHSMVRSIVGTLVDVGRGKISWQEINDIIDAKDRKRIGITAPPQGLFLEKVEY